MDYLDFELEIQPGTGRDYPIAVLHSPAGEARATMHFPFDQLALESRLDKLKIALLRSGGKRRQLPSDEERAVQDFGQALFDAVFTGEIRSRYDVSRERAEREERGLRLKLNIQSPDLAMLPWELLYDPRAAEYLVLSRDTPLVRYMQLGQPVRPLRIVPPLRILGMVASPEDLEMLDVEREKLRVERAIADLRRRGLVELTWLEGQTWQDLQRGMRGGPWHVFHFVGHGGFDTHSDEGVVVLTAEDGNSSFLYATQLSRLLADHHSLRLVFLNACESGRSGNRDTVSSTASILVRRGIPAVVAMQYEITDRAAIELARAFYETLADGLGVDTAVVEARKAVSLELANAVEWCTPVLYMRAPDGMLFDLTPHAPARIAVPESAEAPTSQPAKTPASEAPPVPSATSVSIARESASDQLIIDRSIHLALARVPAGEFLIGSDKAQDPEAEESEFPRHRLYLPEFLIGKHPVTVAEFEVFVRSSGYKTTAEQIGSGYNWSGLRWQETKGANWRQPRGLLSHVRDKRNHPVSQISWLDAQAFCEWASRITGRPVWLPSEAEWEKAARGTDGRLHPWGNEPPTDRLCNFTTSFFTLHVDTTPVDRYSPGGDSPYGCTDMVGNVLEWTRSLWGKDGARAEYVYPYQPGDGREDTEAGIDVMRVLRGGSFYDGRSQMRCAVRRAAGPRYRLTSIGFRVAVAPSHS